MAEKTRNETAADEELKTLRERLKVCEFLLIGLGSEWEKAGGAEVQEAYRALASMTEGKDYFIVTTAKDARIFESPLDEAKITAPCGNVNWLQCSKGCTKDIWERGEVADGICPHCGAPLTEKHSSGESVYRGRLFEKLESLPGMAGWNLKPCASDSRAGSGFQDADRHPLAL